MKFIDLNQQYKRIKAKTNKDILDVLEKGDFILGDRVQRLETKLANYVGVRHCVSCASGTDALMILLMAKGIGYGDAVFTTNFSFFATTEVITLLGATPIFVDIDEKTFNLNPEKLESEINRVKKERNLKPKAIISVDLFGLLADYEKISHIAEKHNLFLLEDAAQSFGATYKDKRSCSFGDGAATSFYPAKPLGCYGDGGAIFLNDSDLVDKCKSIRVHGQGINKYDNIQIGINSRLDTIQAAVLLNKLEIFDDELILRNKIAEFYTEKLSHCVDTPYIPANYMSSWAQYSILLNNSDERDELIAILSKHNVPTAIFYKYPFNKNKVYKSNIKRKFPVSEKISKQILSLPMHPYLSKKDINSIVSVISDFYC